MIFIDSGALIAKHHASDQYHKEAVRLWDRILQEKKSRLDPFLSAMIGVPEERGEFRRKLQLFGECSGYIPEITAVLAHMRTSDCLYPASLESRVCKQPYTPWQAQNSVTL